MAELTKECVSSLLASTSTVDDVQRESQQTCESIDYITSPISYEEFFSKYLLPNRPCILGSWVTEEWRSRKEWLTQDGKPDCTFLKEHFGAATVPVADCEQEVFDSHLKRDMNVVEYMDYLSSTLDATSSYSAHYLKDWHFVRDFPEYQAYITPPFFRSDWLNEYWDRRKADAEQKGDDYRFVYIGPKGSWTPFHADVFRSYSWSANICGRKKWIFFPPGEEEKLKDRLGNLAFDLRSDDLSNKTKFPHADTVERRMEVIQEDGEVIFVPSRWHHQVFNLEATISINHNWLNGCNVLVSWRHLVDGLSDVKRELADCIDMDGWDNQCQLILLASSGIDYAEFFNFIALIGRRRMEYLQQAHADQRHNRTGESVSELKSENEGLKGEHDGLKSESDGLKTESAELKTESSGLKGRSDGPKCKDLDKLEHKPVKTGNKFEDESEEELKCEAMLKDCHLHTEENTTKKAKHEGEGDNCNDLNIYHAFFDLLRIETVLMEMLGNKDFQEIDWKEKEKDPQKCLSEVQNAIKLFKEVHRM